MKKIYNSIQCHIVEIRVNDIITGSINATVTSDGVTGGHALTPGREFDDFNDF